MSEEKNSNLMETVTEGAAVQAKKKNKIIIGVTAVVTVLIVFYIVMAVIFRFHTMFNTSINGIECSFQNFAGITDTIQKEVDKYELELVAVDGKTYVVKGTDIGLHYDQPSELKAICEGQDMFLWPGSLFTHKI